MSDDLVAVFQEELAELLESLESGLIDLKENPEDAGLVNQVFRDLHTVKGSGAMFGFTDLAAFIHDFETAFEKVRSGSVPVTIELVNLGLAARDQIPGLAEGTPDPDGIRDGILSQLKVLTEGGTVEVSEAEEAAPEPTIEPEETGPATLEFHLIGESIALGARPDILLKELIELGATDIEADLSDMPKLADLEIDNCHVTWRMTLPSGVSNDDIDDVFMFVEADWKLAGVASEPEAASAPPQPKAQAPKPAEQAKPAAKASKPAAPAKQAEPRHAAAQPAASIRVPAARLDGLMDSVGELVTVEARLTELARRSKDSSLLSAAEEITRLAGRLRDATMHMRMVPMNTLVSRFRRLMMGLSEDLGRPVDFVVEGEDTELDKTVIEKLADPLVHILRNAIDHGMEPSPEIRAENGKPEKGTIVLSAEHAGGEVLIKVSDDGRGIDREVIRQKGIDKGLISSEAILTDNQIFNLILEPGFSTAEVVTELSGRGVGMDVVKRTIESLRGQIDINSELGVGSTVTLRLPLTLAIIDGLLMEIAGERYTLPMSSVKEIFELPQDKAVPSKSGDFMDIRGQYVPFVRLRKLFECEGEAPEDQNVVIVQAGHTQMGVVVDRIIGTNQTVIKQVSKLQRGAKAISGATILGDGSVSLILDVAQLVAISGPLTSPEKEAAA